MQKLSATLWRATSYTLSEPHCSVSQYGKYTIICGVKCDAIKKRGSQRNDLQSGTEQIQFNFCDDLQ